MWPAKRMPRFFPLFMTILMFVWWPTGWDWFLVWTVLASLSRLRPPTRLPGVTTGYKIKELPSGIRTLTDEKVTLTDEQKAEIDAHSAEAEAAAEHGKEESHVSEVRTYVWRLTFEEPQPI